MNKQKTMKKIAAMLLAVAMLMMAVPVIASADSSLPPDEGTLIIHKYIMNDASQANDPNDGNEAGTGNNDHVPGTADVEPLNGITFDIYEVVVTNGIYPKNVAKIELGESTNKFKDTTGAWFTLGNKSQVTTAHDDSLGDGIGKITLSKGIYLVVEQGSNDVTPAAPFVVAVPMTNPSGDGWLTNVHVYPKNEGFSVTKSVDAESFTVGDFVTFTITTDVPSDIDSLSKFDIFDELDDALIIDEHDTPDSIVVTGDVSGELELGDGKDYKTWLNSGDDNGQGNDTLDTIRIEILSGGRAKLKAAGDTKLTVEFKVKLNAEILDDANHRAPNTAKVIMTNSGVETEHPSNTVEIHTGSIVIDKYDARDKNTKLSGAKFRIATSVDNAKEGIFLQKDEYGEIYQGYGPDDDEMWEETTNSDGVAKFEGIADGLKDSDGEDVSGNTYYLVEIKAPDGYNLLSEPVAVTFVSGAQKANKNNNYSMKAEIMNNTGFELPKTGGMGTVVFTVGGAVLMGLAVLIFVICRKKDKEENAEA